MRLCFLHSDITLVGGIERVTSVLANYFITSDNINIDIVSQFPTNGAPNYPLADGIHIIYLSDRQFARKPGSIKRLFGLLGNIKLIRNHFKSNSYDYVIAQAFPNAFLLYCCGFNMKKVIAVEQVHCNYYNRLIKQIRLFVYKKVHKVVVLTGHDKQYFDTYLPPEKTVVIPNPVNLEDVFVSPLNTKQIITVGRLEYQKGYDNLIDIFAKIHQKHPEWILNIYGKGSLKESLSGQIKRLGLENTVFLRGITNNINQVLRNSSFFIMSSHFEGFGMVLTEAMSQGVPCISFKCPNGPADIITDRVDGILVADQDMQAMESAINFFIEHPEERMRMGKQAAHNVTRFGVSELSKHWMNLFRE